MTERFGVSGEACGGEPGDGACESCIQRAVRRGRWSLRQILPLTYRTRYHTTDGTEWYAVWRMWLGRVFAYDRVRVAPS